MNENMKKPSERIEELIKGVKGCNDCGGQDPHEICYPSEADRYITAIKLYLDEIIPHLLPADNE